MEVFIPQVPRWIPGLTLEDHPSTRQAGLCRHTARSLVELDEVVAGRTAGPGGRHPQGRLGLAVRLCVHSCLRAFLQRAF